MNSQSNNNSHQLLAPSSSSITMTDDHHHHHSSIMMNMIMNSPTSNLLGLGTSLQPFEVPDAFGMVEDGIYRSSVPKVEKQFQFLKTLNLKTILFLSQEIILKSFASFLEEERIDLIELGLLISNRTLSGGLKMSTSKANLSNSASTNSLLQGDSSPHSPNGSSPKPSLFSPSPSNSSLISTATTVVVGNTVSSTTNQTQHAISSSSTPYPSLANSTVSPIPPALQIINNISLSNIASSKGSLGFTDEIYNTKHCTDDLIKEALEILMNKSHHPIMVVCSSGIHLTGTLIGCLRKLQDWSLTSIFTEYECFAGNNSRHIDQQFIEMFDTDLVTLPTGSSGNLPQWFVEHKRMKREEEREFEEMMKYLAMKKNKPVQPPIPTLTTPHQPLENTTPSSSGHHRTGSIVISHHGHTDLHVPATGSSSVPSGPNSHHFPSATLVRPHSPSRRSSNGMINLNNIKKSNSNDSIHHQQQHDTATSENTEPPFKFTYQRYLMDKHCPLISEKSNYSASSIVEDEDD